MPIGERAELAELIRAQGGHVAYAVTPRTTHYVGTANDVAWNTYGLHEARALGAKRVTVDFVSESVARGRIAPVRGAALLDGDEEEEEEDEEDEEEERVDACVDDDDMDRQSVLSGLSFSFSLLDSDDDDDAAVSLATESTISLGAAMDLFDDDVEWGDEHAGAAAVQWEELPRGALLDAPLPAHAWVKRSGVWTSVREVGVGTVRAVSHGHMHAAIVTFDGHVWVTGRMGSLKHSAVCKPPAAAAPSSPSAPKATRGKAPRGSRRTSKNKAAQQRRRVSGHVGRPAAVAQPLPAEHAQPAPGPWCVHDFHRVMLPPAVCIVQVACGWSSSVAVDSSGVAWAWGENAHGQLGAGAMATACVPTRVDMPSGAAPIVQVAAGKHHALALTTERCVYAWGWGQDGQLGVDSRADEHVPVLVHALTDCGVRRIACGARHSAAVGGHGHVWMFGANDRGQLGDATRATRRVPTLVELLREQPMSEAQWVVTVECGDAHTAALTRTGRLWTWGCGQAGCLADGTICDRATPRAVCEHAVCVTCRGNTTSVWTSSREEGTFFCGVGSDGTRDTGRRALGLAHVTYAQLPMSAASNPQGLAVVTGITPLLHQFALEGDVQAMRALLGELKSAESAESAESAVSEESAESAESAESEESVESAESVSSQGSRSTRGTRAESVATSTSSASPSSAANATLGRSLHTLLHVAARHGHVGVVRLLIDYGADVGRRTRDLRRTALHEAAEAGHAECVRVLAQRGERDAGDANGDTALHLAVRHEHADCMHVLLDLAADKTVRNGEGSTCLHVATMLPNNVRLARTLVQHAARIDLDDEMGRTPLDCCTDPDEAAVLTRIAHEHDVFLSYAHANVEFTRQLKNELERHGIRCWVDEARMQAGMDWRGSIGEGIISTKVVIFVVSHQSVESEWCIKELLLAKHHHKPVFSVWHEDVDIPAVIKPVLKKKRHVPFQTKVCFSRSLDTLLTRVRSTSYHMATAPPPHMGGQSSAAQSRKTAALVVEEVMQRRFLCVLHDASDGEFASFLAYHLEQSGITCVLSSALISSEQQPGMPSDELFRGLLEASWVCVAVLSSAALAAPRFGELLRVAQCTPTSLLVPVAVEHDVTMPAPPEGVDATPVPHVRFDALTAQEQRMKQLMFALKMNEKLDVLLETGHRLRNEIAAVRATTHRREEDLKALLQ